jgi:hypothetical protein
VWWFNDEHVSEKDGGVGGVEEKGYTFVKENGRNQVMKVPFQRLTDF